MHVCSCFHGIFKRKMYKSDNNYNMTEVQQDKTWANIPREAKELARNLYRTSHIPQYEAVLEMLFGRHNLYEPEFKVGDMVVVSEDIPRGLILGDNRFFTINPSRITYISGITATLSLEINGVTKTQGFPIKYLRKVIIGGCAKAAIAESLTGVDWEAIRIALASKIAVAYAEKGRYEPSEIGANAVGVANGVINGLKEGEL